MERLEQPINTNNEKLSGIAFQLDELQKIENDGRGVSCVRSAVAYLRAGDLKIAKQICWHDHDKIINYSKLVEFIKNNLFEAGEEHPWSVLERLQRHD